MSVFDDDCPDVGESAADYGGPEPGHALIEDDELTNGLRHMADDHPCCRGTIELAIARIKELEAERDDIEAENGKLVDRCKLYRLAQEPIQRRCEDAESNWRKIKAENATLRDAMESARALRDLVDGAGTVTWSSERGRLRDAKQWTVFYCAVAKWEREKGGTE